MKQYAIFSGLWRAPIFQKSFYVDVGTQWRGVGIRYLLMLELLTWLIFFIPTMISFNNIVENQLPTDIKDFPPITLTAGVASSPVEQPYIMKDYGRPVFVLDTTGKVNLPSEVGAVFLITKTEYVQDDRRGMIRRNPLKIFPDGTYDQAWIMSWARTARNLYIPVGLPTMIVCAGIVRLIGALILASIGLGLNSAFAGKLSFAALLRLSIVSMTASMLISAVAGRFWNMNFCFGFFLFSGLTFGYMIFGVKVSADATRPVSGFPIELPEIPPPAPNP